jgi:hypothetical protein
LDVAAICSPGKVALLLGDGRGRFRPAAGSPLAVDDSAPAIAAGDFNRDGRADLAVGSRANQVIVWLAR